VAGLMGAQGKKQMGLNHPRAGDLIAVGAEHAWFTYYYWLDDAKAPDFARTVDIRRKPGYDPVELFLDPKIPAVKLKILWRLLQKRLGFRMLMNVIPLDANLVKGSHGRNNRPEHNPVLIAAPRANATKSIDSRDVFPILQRAVE